MRQIMNLVVALLLLLGATFNIVIGSPYPYGYDDDYGYMPHSRPPPRYLTRPRMSGGYYGGRSMYGHPRSMGRLRKDKEEDDKDEDENKANREKIAKALEAQEMVVDTVIPFMQSLVPSLGNIMPMRMRRSSGIPSDLEGDQLSMPSEASVLMVPSPEMISQATGSQFSPDVTIEQMSRQAAPEQPENNRENFMSQASSSILRSMPSFLQASSRMLMPHATIRSGDDDKIYFAVDRKTILDFLSALFGGEMRSALASALQENNVVPQKHL